MKSLRKSIAIATAVLMMATMGATVFAKDSVAKEHSQQSMSTRGERTERTGEKPEFDGERTGRTGEKPEFDSERTERTGEKPEFDSERTKGERAEVTSEQPVKEAKASQSRQGSSKR